MLIRAKFAGKCRRCGGRVRKGEMVEWERGIKGVEHAACFDPTYVDTSEPVRDDGLVTVPGDNRLFARTSRGLRAGYEHTGHRCEDAPCCGCCD